MGANLDITEKLQNYINDFGLNLHPVQQEIINYNKTLGDIIRMQIDPCLLYTSPSPRDRQKSRMPSSA